MCKKLIYLVSFVCMLGLVSAAMADDLNPPPWAGGPGSYYGNFNFNENIPCPEEERGFPLLIKATPECMVESPLGETEWMFEDDYWEWIVDEMEFECPEFDPEGMIAHGAWGTVLPEDDPPYWVEEFEGRTGLLYCSNLAIDYFLPNSGDYQLRIRYQITFQGDTEEEGYVGLFTEHAEPEGEYWDYEIIDEVDLGDGWQYACYEGTLSVAPGWMMTEMWHATVPGDVDWPCYIDQIVVDLIPFQGDDPDDGPGTPCGRGVAPVVKVSNEQPEDGEEHVDPNDPNIVCFQPPANALCMDPCADPCLCGPFEYDVYFSSDPCELVWIPPTIGPTNANDVMCVDPCDGDLLPGTEYFWRVDITDANCCPEEPPGDPCFYEGPIFSFITWGFAYDPVPADGEEDVDTGTIQLSWTGDGFVGAAGTGYDVYFPEDTPVGYQDCDTADANKYTPAITLELGTEYCWRVDEVNVVTVEGHVWCFSTSLCSTWETFEDYADRDAIVAVWVDWETNGTGSWIYLGESSDNEPVHSGDQSMEYYYDNIYDPFYSSESTRTFSPTVDWSPESDIAPGARALRIWFHDTDEEGAGAEQMYVKLYDGTTEGRVDFDPDTSVTEEDETWIEATDEDVLWIGWSIALSDFGVELSTIESMTIGFDEEDTDGLVFFDTFQLCGTRCIPAQAPWSWNDDCVTEWFELEEMIFESWLAMDEWVHIVAPNDANLIVEYTFDNDDLTDTAGDFNGIGVNEPNIHDGLMTLDGNDWVIVPISHLELFQGDKSWTVVMDAAPDNVGIMFGVSREPWGLNEDGYPEYYYDPCICNDPCEPDANFCDAGLPPYPFEDTHALVFYQEEGGIVAERHEFGDAWFEKDDEWGESYQVVVVYDAEDPEDCQIYIDEAEGDPWWDDDSPNVPDPCDDTVSIGHTENISIRPGEDFDPYDVRENLHWMGDIDNFRIYNYALSYGEILGLVYPEDVCTDYPFLLDTIANVDDQTVNYDGRARQIINLRDFALFAEHWLEVVLWPPEE